MHASHVWHLDSAHGNVAKQDPHEQHPIPYKSSGVAKLCNHDAASHMKSNRNVFLS